MKIAPIIVAHAAILILLFVSDDVSFAQSTKDCGSCHPDQLTLWKASRHANTQNDVAGELALNWKGETPDSVINGSNAEDCVSCHSPTSIKAAGGGSEVWVMGHFFTTTGGVYTASTESADSANWPHVWCTSCHNVRGTHPSTMPVLAIYQSKTALYDTVVTSAALCGQCHGTLRDPATDHRIYDAWKLSRHGHRGQTDLAGELAASWAGQPPDSVINGSQAENCIACHSPTSVNMSKAATEVDVLSRYFTTTGGLFTSGTTATDTLHWPDISCTTCHIKHKPDSLAYFNSTTKAYESVNSSNELCGRCHGNLRFPDTDHRSYNIELGTGGMGVADKVTMPGIKCVDCHMHKGDVDGTNSLMYKGHAWSAFIHEPDGSTSASCSTSGCHPLMTADSARSQVNIWKDEFHLSDSVAQVKVDSAKALLKGSTDPVKLQLLQEAEFNMGYAELDESGGVHNHLYTMSLLNDAIAKATVLTGVATKGEPQIPHRFALLQNYPNPFNPSTTLRYELARRSRVKLEIFNMLGQLVATLVDREQDAQYYEVTWRAAVASGVYLYRLQAVPADNSGGTFVQVKKMVLMK